MIFDRLLDALLQHPRLAWQLSKTLRILSPWTQDRYPKGWSRTDCHGNRIVVVYFYAVEQKYFWIESNGDSHRAGELEDAFHAADQWATEENWRLLTAFNTFYEPS